MGIGMALLEETDYDPRNGAPMNAASPTTWWRSTPMCLPSRCTSSNTPTLGLNELGARGMGEIGLAGFAAAVTSAVHHATGVRARELPVKIEDLLA